MTYLELEELEIGQKYICEDYDGNDNLILEYKGDGTFEQKIFLTVLGDVRYIKKVWTLPEVGLELCQKEYKEHLKKNEM